MLCMEVAPLNSARLLHEREIVQHGAAAQSVEAVTIGYVESL